MSNRENKMDWPTAMRKKTLFLAFISSRLCLFVDIVTVYMSECSDEEWTSGGVETDGEYVPSPTSRSESGADQSEPEAESDHKLAVSGPKSRALDVLRREKESNQRTSTSLKKKSGFKRPGLVSAALKENVVAAAQATRLDDHAELREQFFRIVLTMNLWEPEPQSSPQLTPEECVSFADFEAYRLHFHSLMFEELRSSMLSELEANDPIRGVSIAWLDKSKRQLLQRSKDGVYRLCFNIDSAGARVEFNDAFLLKMQDKRGDAPHPCSRIVVIVQDRTRPGGRSYLYLEHLSFSCLTLFTCSGLALT